LKEVEMNMMAEAAREAGLAAASGANALAAVAPLAMSDLAVAAIGSALVIAVILGSVLGNHFAADDRAERISNAFSAVSFGPNDYLDWYASKDPAMPDYGLGAEEDSSTRAEVRIPSLTDLLGLVFLRVQPIMESAYPPIDVALGFEDACSEFFQQYLIQDFDHASCTIFSNDDPTSQHYEVVIAVNAFPRAETGISEQSLVHGVNYNMQALIFHSP
jgi:hypothetical protein